MSNARANDFYDDYKDREFQEPYTLFVGNLPPNTIQADIDTIFQEIKDEIKSIRVIHDRQTNAFRGFCYVEFKTEQALRTALTFDNAEYLGYSIKVDYADAKKKEGGRSVTSRNSGGAGSTTGSQSGGFRNNNNNYNNSRGSAPRVGNGGGHQDNGSRGKGYYGSGGRGGYMQQGGNGGGAPAGYNQGGYAQNSGGQRGYNNNYSSYQQGGNNYNQGGNGGGYNKGGSGQPRGYNNRFPRQDQRNMSQPPPLEPAPDSEGRPKLVLNKRATAAPTASLANTESRSKIFGNALPREFNAKVSINDNDQGPDQPAADSAASSEQTAPALKTQNEENAASA